ncbi:MULTISPECIES: Hpt domain-containing protein [Mesorhizobium]|uniref:Hpt domain-containing protein n=2 Tax=Mesorhizobium TaxID=68287 RepID=A0ABU5APR9_9HYPH|nr:MULTISPECIES: Hpt domain-containing protein [Mesorhizobium]MDX8436424.1 Hpt domain-containing protein [Mesorhizobium abyssinicae]MDX8539285.1 Hpt domain-containing protein [Mesorhizobium abyssinicae]RUW20057.1 histidine kinase [Mesorhizobium sp. M4B.F.Ca.ET.013.02.1.1]RUW74289.1 histidine kinase [Mesorhizobium sp. M4B.F.Ca.ET.049.02.1.2]RVD15209.1 histidine kinase [Mesorhizobium sp. M4B.F.Ca.ET.017.02.2.1]
MRGESGIAFSMPGGDVSGTARSRPVDLAHLSRQTMGDRALEQEVLALFVQQALGVRDKILEADVKERLLLAHGLKGSARGVGAFAIADCAAAIEGQPEDAKTLNRLGVLIEEVREFIAAIGR